MAACATAPERDKTQEASTSSRLSPLFVQRPPLESLRGQVRREARLRMLGARNSMILDNSKLEQIWYVLRQYVGLSNYAVGEDRLNYDEFCQASAACQDIFGDMVEQYFKPSVFIRLDRDGNGAVSLLSFFNYIMRRNAMLQTRVHLSCFDEVGQGSLSEEQLQSYITQLVPELPGLVTLEQHLDLETYSRTAVRKFSLLQSRNGRMRIRELLPSSSLAELLEMRLPVPPDSGELAGPPSNWFSLASVVKLRHQFLALDADGNGHLSMLEFAGFSSGTMSPLFISRIFEEHASAKQQTGSTGAAENTSSVQGEMSFAQFLDFVLAWDYRSTPAGARYFFPVLDLNGRGYLTQVELYAFLKEIYTMWVACGQYPELSIEDIKDEIFDIVQPTHPLHITAKDLTASGMAGTIISILADVNLFWEYDNRESLLQSEDGEASAV